MRPRPSPRAALLLAAAALLLAACGAPPSPADAPAATAPVAGGVLRFAVGSDQGCVDPHQVGSNDQIHSVRQIVDSLTDQDPDTGEIVPWLAESWEPNADASAWTFTLREGVTFSDGTPLDAEAVKANLDRVPELGVRATLPKGYLAGYTGTTVDGPLRFTVSFEGPDVQFLQGTSTHSLGILAPASVALSDDERCAGVVGSGPFVLDTYVRDQSITYVKRAGYDWGSSLWEHAGEAYLDRLEFEVVPESGVRSGSLQAGEVDAIGSIGQQDEGPLTAAGAQLLARPNPGQVFGISFNASRPVPADPAVRRAISAAIDRAQVVGGVFTSQTLAATSVLSSTTPGHADQGIASDAARAASLLDAAGWAPGPDGIRAKDGQRLALEVLYFANAGTNEPALELIQQQLRAVGVEIVLGERPIADAQAVQQSGEFDALWGNLTRADPHILRTLYSTRLNNFYRLPPGELDDVLAEQAATPDEAARAELVARAQQLIVENAWTVPVVELTTVLGVSPDVRGIRFDASSRIHLFDAWRTGS
jgi:peptide/nickel transport system substrate-binding protein